MARAQQPVERAHQKTLEQQRNAEQHYEHRAQGEGENRRKKTVEMHQEAAIMIEHHRLDA
jgi:hypothetical protein